MQNKYNNKKIKKIKNKLLKYNNKLNKKKQNNKKIKK